MQNHCYRLRWVLVLACILACHGCAQPTPEEQKAFAEELRGYIGKTEEDVRKKFGSPKSIGQIDSALPPKEYYDHDKDIWNKLRERTAQRTLQYGDVDVMVNSQGIIVGVRRKPTTIEEPTVEKLKEMIGKTKDELRERFGYVRNETYLNPLPLENLSGDERERFYQQETARIISYGGGDVCFNIYDEIVDVRLRENEAPTAETD